MEIEYIYTVILMISAISLVMIAFLFYINYRRKDRIQEQKTKAELSYMREYFEKQMYDLNNKYTKDQNRWEEMNHLLLSYKPEVNKNYFSPKPIFNQSFFKNFGITALDREIDKNLVFVLTPFFEKERQTFSAIQRACNEFGLETIRGDEQFIQGDIFKFILNRILDARIVIANINGRNPNVYYELGIAQAIGKPTLLISKNLDDVPFDLQSQNIIIYNDVVDLESKLSNMLGKLLVQEF